MDETSAVNVRLPQDTDITSIIRINRLCLPENYPYSFFHTTITKNRNICVVAECEGDIIGYVLSRTERTLSRLFRAPSARGHIISIAVLNDFRRKGIAETMMAHVMTGFNEMDVRSIVLEVRESNTAAIEFYVKLQFEKSKVLEGYYVDGENGLLMEWTQEKE